MAILESNYILKYCYLYQPFFSSHQQSYIEILLAWIIWALCQYAPFFCLPDLIQSWLSFHTDWILIVGWKMSWHDAVTAVCCDTTASVSHFCTSPWLQYVNSLMQLEPSVQKSMIFHPNHALHSEYPFTKLITVNQPCIVIIQNTVHWNRFCMYGWYCCLVVFRNHFTYIEISHIHT